MTQKGALKKKATINSVILTQSKKNSKNLITDPRHLCQH